MKIGPYIYYRGWGRRTLKKTVSTIYMIMIKAIDTKYGNHFFRSRLEARWAVYFDNLSVKWVYEPEGYELPSGRYLPDFWLPDHGFYAEVKPEEVKDPRWKEFVELIEKPMMILIGLPALRTYPTIHPEGYSSEGFLVCGWNTKYFPVYYSSADYFKGDPEYAQAIEAACSARFE
jgi:hypothetical protein